MSYWAIGVASLTSNKVVGRGSNTTIIESEILFISPPKSILLVCNINTGPPSSLLPYNYQSINELHPWFCYYKWSVMSDGDQYRSRVTANNNSRYLLTKFPHVNRKSTPVHPSQLSLTG